MILVLFWVSVILIIYVYFIFPVLVILRGFLWRQPYRSDEITLRVSIVIAAFNESKTIGDKLNNILTLDYPRDQLEVVIASDGSDDGTNEIVRRYEEYGVRLLPLPRQGKARALNAAVAVANGEILVFSDANSIYKPDAIQALVKPFADPNIGGVAGNQCYLRNKETDFAGAGESSYWDFDRVMKQFQSNAGNAVSATGAIYAIRRSLFQTIPEGVTDDFVTSTGVIAQGYRLIFTPDAVAYEPVAESNGMEFGRKVRVITRGLRAVFVTRIQLLNPFRYGFYAIQLFSHKALRRLIVYPLLLLLLVNPFLWRANIFYQLAMIGQLIFYGFGFLGLLLNGTRLGRMKIFSIPFYFCLVNAAVLVASMNVLRGQQIKRWEPQRNVNSDNIKL